MRSLVLPSLALISAACVGDLPASRDSGADTGGDAVTPPDSSTSDAGPAGGVLDPTFKNGRKDASLVARAVAVDGKSRVYVAGTIDKCVGALSSGDFAVMRFTAEGDLDTTYGNAGTVCVELGTGNNADTGNVIAIDAVGRAVIGGRSFNNAGSPKYGIGLVRLTEAGKPDTSFNGSGILRVPNAADLVALGLAFDGGFLYAVGANSYDDSLATAGFVLKVSEGTGAPESGFGAGGVLAEASMRGCNAVSASSGFLYVAGSSNSSPRQFAVRKLTTAGAPVATFGAGGLAMAAPSSGDSEGMAVAVRSDGAVYVAGPTGSALGQLGISGALRFLPNGALDGAFAPFVSSTLRWDASSGRMGVYATPGGVVVPGLVATGQRSPALTRATPAGALDPTFGAGGIALPPYTSDNSLRATARDPQTSRIVVLGDDPGHVFLSRFVP